MNSINVRERLIRLIQLSPSTSVLNRKLIRSFDKSRRAEAEIELSLLISQGYVNPIGTGRRGSPKMVTISPTWPFNKCPLCGLIR